MELNSLKLAAITTLALSVLALPLRGQTPPAEEPSPITLGEIKIEQAKLPGGELTWTKVLINFTSTQKWLDGFLLNVRVLLEEQGRQRVVSGNVRYGNVPGGPQVAVFYLSPRATARFGSPAAVYAAAFYNDKEAGTKSWTNGKSSPASDWATQSGYPGILLTVLQTPWLMIDYEKSPDVIAIQ